MDSTLPNEIEKYYIAYVDILGYKDFFCRYPDQVPCFLKSINDAIQGAKKHVDCGNHSQIMKSYADMNVVVKIFSDNILLCLKTSNSQLEIIRLLTFLAIVAEMQRDFIVKYGLFLRGGVTIGDLSVNEDFVFGQGLIDVVDMESKANYPRIIVSKSMNDFIFSRHYITESELQHCTDIINKIQQNNPICLEEENALNSYNLRLPMELYSSLWGHNLIFRDAGGHDVLNYLYILNYQTMMSESLLQNALIFLKTYFSEDYTMIVDDCYDYTKMLMDHKKRVEEKLFEYGKYDDINTDDIKNADLREKILKKYLWVMMFHNFIAQKEQMLEYIINASVNCENRFMKMTIKLPETNNGKI